jgi:hypothetical protein
MTMSEGEYGGSDPLDVGGMFGTPRPQKPYQEPKPMGPRRIWGDPQLDWAKDCALAGRPVTILSDEEVARRRQAMSPTFVAPAGSPVTVASALLSFKLAAGPVQVAALLVEAKRCGVSESTLRRAKKAMGLRAIRVDDEWLWTWGGAPGTR